MRSICRPVLVAALLSLSSAAVAQNSKQSDAAPRRYRFQFGGGDAAQNYTKIDSQAPYSKDTGYGFEPGADVKFVSRGASDLLHSGLCTSEKPFCFSVALPEGNYRVTVTLGDAEAASTTTIKAELRRLMLEHVQTEPGKFAERTFIVNLRRPDIAGDRSVRLKPREKTDEFWDWDEKLTLEFNDSHPALCALEIESADRVPTVYILGDSTVCDQPAEPWNSWGQMLPRFFKPEVAVANHAESGESLRGALGAHRLEKVLSTMKPGDYLFIQFGHNDMKEKGAGVGAFTTYKTDLKRFVADARKRGGIPVLVTSMHRKSLESDGHVKNTLGDYPDAVRQVAKEEDVTLIDLHAMSKDFYEALGPENIGKAFQDGTHHNNYGSYELAKCVVEGIRRSNLDLGHLLVDDVPKFDPKHPDSPAEFHMPASPSRSARKPEGN